ncbi:hypothetical protein BDZ89DRAFT_1159611 [Hymenopellis radicata]|nr:hypothetical protein BDZ89DRAFT_1159611 [Hymenopellis radicata]
MDRSASHWRVLCGSQTQRTTRGTCQEMVVACGGRASDGTCSVSEEDKMVRTYVSRQGLSRPKLTAESHDLLMIALVARKNKEFEVWVDGLAGITAAGVKHADAVMARKKKRWRRLCSRERLCYRL